MVANTGHLVGIPLTLIRDHHAVTMPTKSRYSSVMKGFNMLAKKLVGMRSSL